VRVLLDTSVFLWWVSSAADRLSERARWAIEEPDNDVFLSVASAWEIAIKAEQGRLSLPAAAERYLPDLLARTGFSPLVIQLAHVLRAGALPPHHRDPFDRLLVAQSQIEDAPIVTADPAIGRYEVEIIW
jgi:PIN domain nuclease of toxin-antitoxin system